MNKELKKTIINWLLENESEWQRINSCCDNFRGYIYDNNGNFLIGGEVISNFIREADKLLYAK